VIKNTVKSKCEILLQFTKTVFYEFGVECDLFLWPSLQMALIWWSRNIMIISMLKKGVRIHICVEILCNPNVWPVVYITNENTRFIFNFVSFCYH